MTKCPLTGVVLLREEFVCRSSTVMGHLVFGNEYYFAISEPRTPRCLSIGYNCKDFNLAFCADLNSGGGFRIALLVYSTSII